MKWKEILIGAFLTLIVTIVAGIAVYYFTKEPDEKKIERLAYSVQQSASFTGGNQDLAFSSVTIENNGGVAAKQVVLKVTFKSAEIKDFALSTNASSKDVSREVDSKSISLKYETLLPNESITLSLLLSSDEKPFVTLRSEAALGREKMADGIAVVKQKKLSFFLERSIPISTAFMALFTVFLAFYYRRSGLASDRNNAGFLLLHHGMIDDADAVLTSSLHSGRYDGFTLSNLALCKALKGEVDQARQLLNAANFRERFGHEKAVVLFNEAIVSFIDGNRDDGLRKLKESIRLSPAKIRRYCQRSMHLDVVRNDPAINEILKDL